MNPLFIAHIVADFLLQPTWLVRLKEKSYAGIILHAAIHATIMLLFWIPRDLSAGIYILGIAIAHGLIDTCKIHYQKKNPGFDAGFIIDQFAHFLILVGASFLLPAAPKLWQTQAGFSMLMLMFFFSLGLALWNLRETQNQTPGAKLKRIVLITLVFLLFLIPPVARASSFCFGL